MQLSRTLIRLKGVIIMNPNNEIEQPGFYSIVPAPVRYDERLKGSEKLLFSEIVALCNESNYCTASNGYFAKLYKVDKSTVSRWISHLKKLNYVKTESYFDEHLGNRRRIYPNMIVLVYDTDHAISLYDQKIGVLVDQHFSKRGEK